MADKKLETRYKKKRSTALLQILKQPKKHMKGNWAGQVRPGNGGWQQKQTELKTPPPLNAYSQPCVRKMFFHFFNSSASRKPHLPEFCT